MTVLAISTRNLHKVQEIQSILSDRFRCLSLRDFPGAPVVEEDADSFAGNAVKKAVTLARWLGRNTAPLPSNESGAVALVLADDSGLEVDFLHGAPGVHSARFAALDSAKPENSSHAENNEKLLRLLRNVPWEKRTARFRCALALTPVVRDTPGIASPVCFADEAELRTEVFEGSCEGRILEAAAGRGGFGYDPLFVPDRYERSFAELGEEIKNRISHRARALEKLRARLASSGEARG